VNEGSSILEQMEEIWYDRDLKKALNRIHASVLEEEEGGGGKMPGISATDPKFLSPPVRQVSAVSNLYQELVLCFAIFKTI